MTPSRRTLLRGFLALPVGLAVFRWSKPTGAVARYVNVMGFGAVGDGVADDGDAIRRAIAATASAGGGHIYFPPGVYRFAA